MINRYDTSINNELSLLLSESLPNFNSIRPTHSGKWLTLVDMIRNMQGFRTIILEHNNPVYRDSLITQLNHNVDNATIINLTEFTDFESLENRLFKLSEKSQLPNLIHIINLESLDDAFYHGFLKGINYHRELIAEKLQTNILLWCIGSHVDDIATIAPDFWAWREQSIDFSVPIDLSIRWESHKQETSNLEKEKKQQRIDEILQYLATTADDEPKVSRADLLHEIGNLYETIGKLEQAKEQLEQALTMFIKLNEKHAQARVQRDLLLMRYQQEGNPDIVIDELESKILPLFIELKDRKEQAETYDIISSIMKLTGRYNDALKLIQDKIIPIFLELNITRDVAVCKGKIASILYFQGGFYKAFAILTNEVIPIFQKLGDINGIAVSKGQISDILESQGELDKALNIRQREILPVYKKLGDIRAIAVTKGQIADILQYRGELDKALAIRETEELPVYEKIGDMQSIAATKVKTADILWRKDSHKNAQLVRDYLVESLNIFKKMGLVEEQKYVESQLQNKGLPRTGKVTVKNTFAQNSILSQISGFSQNFKSKK